MASEFTVTAGNSCGVCMDLEDKTKMMFAEDLVWFTMGINGCCVKFNRADSYPGLAHIAFTKSVMAAVRYVDDVFSSEVANNVGNLRQRGLLTIASFELYSIDLVTNFIAREQNVESILKTCIHVALTALFYYRADVTTSPYTAVSVIYSAVSYDLSRGGWKMLQDAAENFQRMYYSIHNMPSSSSDDGEIIYENEFIDDEHPLPNDNI